MTDPSPFFAPQQQRSKESLERLLAASEELISNGTFDQATVKDITKKANYSVGAFYSRFPNKEALFDAVQDRIAANTSNWVELQLKSFKEKALKPGNQPELSETVDFCVNLIFQMLSRNPGMYRAIFLHTRLKRDPKLMAEVQDFNTRRVDESIEILKLTKNVNCDAAMVMRWKAGIGLVSAYIREIVLFGGPVPMKKKASQDAMVRAARDMFLSYLLTTDEE